MAFEKGKSGNPKTMFSSTNQPKKNGRKPALYKQLVAMVGKKFNIELSRDDHLKIKGWLLERPISELIAISKDPESPAFIVAQISAILTDIKSGSDGSIERAYDRLYGKALQPTEVSGGLEMETAYNLSELSDDEIEKIGQIMQKATGKKDGDSQKITKNNQ